MNVVIKNLTQKYGNQYAVDNLSFEVKTGEIVGFLGPNGAGKTTTMKAITGYIEPTDGEVFVGNISVTENPNETKRHIGYLPEHNPLYVDMPIIDYLRYMAELQGISKNKITDRVLEMVHICGLEGEKHKLIGELSKGYRQRVGLAQALIHDPEVLILDEPTTGLDPNQIFEIRELIKRIGREKTVILSSHILAEVEATCDRIIIINHGKIVANGTANQLRKAEHGNEIVQVCIEDADRNVVFEKLQQISSIELVDTNIDNPQMFEVQAKANQSCKRDIFALCVAQGWTITELHTVETKLEDVFRDLTLK
ncbi:MAG: ATP-binding cassette domain-containing protein [Salinivirgaceae bacterium]|nr:ATP-binding cassette domain-containing protein [Salinivirgaceae bacterium]